MVFGLVNKAGLEQAINGVYQRVISHVTDVLINPLKNKIEGDGETSGLEARLAQLQNELNDDRTNARKMGDQVTYLREQVAALEAAQHAAGIVSGALLPLGEITFDIVKALAKQVSDEGYAKVRDYFLLEMAKKGYAGELPNFSIYETDSRLGLSFIVLDEEGRSYSNQKTYMSPEYFYEFSLVETSQRGIMALKSKQIGRESYMLHDDSRNLGLGHAWSKALREDLPDMLQAYMLGYSLKCIEKREYDSAVKVQEVHGLKNNPVLLARMQEAMQLDPNLAAQFVTQYSQN